MTPAQQQRKAIERRAYRFARRQPNYEGINGHEISDAIAAAYVAGYKAGNVATVRAPAAALLHVLDTQRELKAKIVQLRAALRAWGDTAMREGIAVSRRRQRGAAYRARRTARNPPPKLGSAAWLKRFSSLSRPKIRGL